MHHVTINQLGPIDFCDMDIDQFLVLTGTQASGKSTIAKVVYFCRTIKDEIYDILEKSVLIPTTQNPSSLRTLLRKRLREKFLRLFGTTWTMSIGEHVKYEYMKDRYVKLSIRKEDPVNYRNFIISDFSPDIDELLRRLQTVLDFGAQPEQLKEKREEINQFFDDSYETVIIPAGRSMITLLTDQLNYLMNSVDDTLRRALDDSIYNYILRILSIRNSYRNGLDGLDGYLKDKMFLTQDRIDKTSARTAMQLIEKILKAKYVYSGSEERLFFDDKKYVKINYASSGQQESVWVFNILFFYLVNNRKTYLILEEPESHLYPDSQKYIADLLGLFAHAGNSALITTHSPYILGEFNNLLYCNEIPERFIDRASKIIPQNLWLPYENTHAYYVNEGNITDAMEKLPGLIRNELIDGASTIINDATDELITLKLEAEDEQ